MSSQCSPDGAALSGSMRDSAKRLSCTWEPVVLRVWFHRVSDSYAQALLGGLAAPPEAPGSSVPGPPECVLSPLPSQPRGLSGGLLAVALGFQRPDQLTRHSPLSRFPSSPDNSELWAVRCRPGRL